MSEENNNNSNSNKLGNLFKSIGEGFSSIGEGLSSIGHGINKIGNVFTIRNILFFIVIVSFFGKPVINTIKNTFAINTPTSVSDEVALQVDAKESDEEVVLPIDVKDEDSEEIIFVTEVSNLNLNTSEINKLIDTYKESYVNALELLNEKDFYTRGKPNVIGELYVGQEINAIYNDSTKIDEIKKEVRAEFGSIITNRTYRKIDYEIFTENLYKDIGTIKYDFDYSNYKIDGRNIIIYPIKKKDRRFKGEGSTEISTVYLQDEYMDSKIFVLDRSNYGGLYIVDILPYE